MVVNPVFLSLSAEQQHIVNSNPEVKNSLINFARSNNYNLEGFSSGGAQPRRSSLRNRQRRRKFLTNKEFDEQIIKPAMSGASTSEPEPTSMPEPEPTSMPKPEPTSMPKPEPTSMPKPEAPKSNKGDTPKSSAKSELEEILSKYKKNVDNITAEKDKQKPSLGEKIWNIAKPVGTLAGLGAMLGLQYKRGKENEKAANEYNDIIRENMREMQRLMNEDPNADTSHLEKENKALEKARVAAMKKVLQNEAMSHYAAHKYNLENRGKGVRMDDLYDLYRGRGSSPDSINDILYNTIKLG